MARILLEAPGELALRAGRELRLVRIVTPHPARSAARHGLPIGLFAGGGEVLGAAEREAELERLLADPELDLVVETIGGDTESVLRTCRRALDAGKHLVTANKALLAGKGAELFDLAEERGRSLGFEGAVCGAIPVIRVAQDGFSGDIPQSVSGIMNGTSNYILSRMQEEGLSFSEALALAQEAGYAEADPTLDISGGDAGHKLSLLVRLAFGAAGELSVRGIQDVSKADLHAAEELGCVIKLICHAQRGADEANAGSPDSTKGGGSDRNDAAVEPVYAAVSPMMVRKTNFLSRVNGATNAVRFLNRYAGPQILVGAGAGSSETGSAVVADIVFAARHGATTFGRPDGAAPELRDLEEVPFPYTIIFDTEDVPGVTGLVTTAIGAEGINIDTVGHNLRGKDTAVFCVETMPCRRSSIERALRAMEDRRPSLFRSAPKIYPVLY